MAEEIKTMNLNTEILDEDSLTNRYLTFIIEDESYAIGIEFVTEIIGIQNTTPIPKVSPHIKGIINLRGLIIPVVSVRYRFEMDDIEYNEKTCIVIIKYQNNDIGLIVDEVSEVIRIENENMSPPPLTSKGSNSDFLLGIGNMENHVHLILDLEKLLNDNKRSE